MLLSRGQSHIPTAGTSAVSIVWGEASGGGSSCGGSSRAQQLHAGAAEHSTAQLSQAHLACPNSPEKAGLSFDADVFVGTNCLRDAIMKELLAGLEGLIRVVRTPTAWRT